MLSDVEFFIPGLTGGSDDTIVYRTLVTEYVLYTNSIFIVNYSNNTLIVNGTTYVIPEGNYDGPQLLQYIYLVCNNLYGTLSILTGIVTWSNGTSFTIGADSTILPLLGGIAGVGYISDEYGYLVMPKPMNLLTTQILRFTCPSIPLSAYFNAQNDSALITIPMSAQCFNTGVYTNTSGMGAH
jgi:hypothetical protein